MKDFAVGFALHHAASFTASFAWEVKPLSGGLGFAGEVEKAPPDVSLDILRMRQCLLSSPLTQPVSHACPLNHRSPVPQGVGMVVQALR